MATHPFRIVIDGQAIDDPEDLAADTEEFKDQHDAEAGRRAQQRAEQRIVARIDDALQTATHALGADEGIQYLTVKGSVGETLVAYEPTETSASKRTRRKEG